MPKKILLDSKKIDLILNRLVCQLIENHKDFKNTVLIGLQPRGTYLIEKILNIFKKKYPSIEHEKVEVQFDSAICPDIAMSKYAKSTLKGSANVLIYPNLDAGNIAYKITERLGGYSAIGPLLQGFNKPVHDLSRGCCVSVIIDVSIIAAYQGSRSDDV